MAHADAGGVDGRQCAGWRISYLNSRHKNVTRAVGVVGHQVGGVGGVGDEKDIGGGVQRAQRGGEAGQVAFGGAVTGHADAGGDVEVAGGVEVAEENIGHYIGVVGHQVVAEGGKGDEAPVGAERRRARAAVTGGAVAGHAHPLHLRVAGCADDHCVVLGGAFAFGVVHLQGEGEKCSHGGGAADGAGGAIQRQPVGQRPAAHAPSVGKHSAGRLHGGVVSDPQSAVGQRRGGYAERRWGYGRFAATPAADRQSCHHHQEKASQPRHSRSVSHPFKHGVSWLEQSSPL